MTRKEKILKHVDRRGYGLEIGPSHNPVAPKREGFRVDVIDTMGREELLGKYQGHGVNLDNIEEVDFVWRGEPYSTLTRRRYDWVIASHVIEHTPDLIAFLNSCDEVLEENGVLSLAVPDKRYCFDRFRPISNLANVIDRHLGGIRANTAGTCAEYYLYSANNAGRIAWNADSETGDFRLSHPTQLALQALRSSPEENSARDVHNWVFVPSSFRLLLQDLHELGLTQLREVEFLPTKGFEFFVTLGRGGKGTGRQRLDLLKDVERELRVDTARFGAALLGRLARYRRR